jgi:hypothetical protein
MGTVRSGHRADVEYQIAQSSLISHAGCWVSVLAPCSLACCLRPALRLWRWGFDFSATTTHLY